ncbi:NDR1/HIN1-like protein 13 [Sesamum alatum]|uniref:NDR1/HIN1-like protein 13 n=1 Tax=Sesamum alatum TaxID=300844 RepID=A0AAE2D0P0_9LAMI|nr:NDR1/HIN1-like protein 13 [Sesamum alatum]
MADPRVHPATAAPLASTSSAATSSENSTQTPRPPNPPPSNPVPPPPATYIVQLPRDQIFRYPPPENARKLEAHTRRKTRRSCCRRCCCFTFCLLLLLIVAAAVSAGVLYLVFGFKSPKYAVTNISIKGMNLTSDSPISPRFDVSIRAENPNGKVGIYYLKDSAVDVLYDNVKLSDGVLPAFYQPRKNVTVLETSLTGTDVALEGAVRRTLSNSQNKRKVPLVVNVKAPVKIKVGSAKTWEISVKVKCDVVVDALSERAKIVSNDCDYSVRLW